MKIAISASSADIEGTVNPVFGRCPGFIIVDAEGGEIKSSEFLENAAMNSATGAGIATAQTVINKGAEAIISGNIGPNAFNVLKQAGIKFYPAHGMAIKEAVKKASRGELNESGSASAGANFGMRGAGRGAGTGTGGRGMGGRHGRRWQQ